MAIVNGTYGREARRAPTAAGRALARAGAGAGLIALALAVSFVSTRADQMSVLQLVLLVALVMGAVSIHLIKPAYLLPYALLVWAAGPEIRRLVDWSFQHYSSTPILSLAPLCVSMVMLLPVLRGYRAASKPVKRIAGLFTAVLCYGLAIGLLRSGIAAIYEFLSYLLPFLTFLYIHAGGFDRKVRGTWMRGFAFIAVVVGAYGIVQYLVLPAWDRFWMEEVEMTSIGHPEPLMVRVFSLLNSPGPAGNFLAFALGAMLVNRSWRFLGPAGIAAVAAALLLTLVRSSWIALIVLLAAYLLASRSARRIRLLLTMAVMLAASQALLPLLPGADAVASRFGTLGSLSEDHSFRERLKFTAGMLPAVASNPIGYGLGSTGVGTKLGGGGGGIQSFDNGYLNLIYTFGLPGGLALLYLLLYLAGQQWRRRAGDPDYAGLSFAAVMAVLFLLLGQNPLPGVGGMLIWFLAALPFLRSGGERSGGGVLAPGGRGAIIGREVDV